MSLHVSVNLACMELVDSLSGYASSHLAFIYLCKFFFLDVGRQANAEETAHSWASACKEEWFWLLL